MPALINTLDDPVPRVQSHCCAALTNFFEGLNDEIAPVYVKPIMAKLSILITNGISIIKENGITALASLAEACKEKFNPYYEDCLKFVEPFLVGFNEPCYK
jgi:importin-5